MQIIQTLGKLKNGQLVIENLNENIPDNVKLGIVIIVPDENKQTEFEQARKNMQLAFQAAEINTREEILQLIKDVKLELFEESLKINNF